MAPWVRKTDGVVLRKIDIVDWKSEAARQMTGEFGAEGIPYVRVYDKSGRFVGEVSGDDFPAVQGLVGRAGR